MVPKKYKTYEACCISQFISPVSSVATANPKNKAPIKPDHKKIFGAKISPFVFFYISNISKYSTYTVKTVYGTE